METESKLSPWVKDITGLRSGRLVAVKYLFTDKKRAAIWECLCDCGKLSQVKSGAIVRGGTKSCGCSRRKNRPPEYEIWRGMIRRCYSPSAHGYGLYGGRGISVCDEWKSFDNFYLDMGPRLSSELTLDRVDTNGNYCPVNCRWATWKDQNRNKRNNRILHYDGKRMCVHEWAEVVGINPITLGSRLDHGWPIERALTEPCNEKNMHQLERTK